MTNLDVIRTFNLLNSTDFNEIKDTKFQYALVKNIKKLESEVKLLEKTLDASKSESLKSLETEAKTKVKNLTLENPSLNAQEVEQLFFRTWEKKEMWEKEIKTFNEIKEAFHEEENPIEFYKVDISKIENLNTRQMYAVFDFSLT